jgi:putative serine protease PepD
MTEQHPGGVPTPPSGTPQQPGAGNAQPYGGYPQTPQTQQMPQQQRKPRRGALVAGALALVLIVGGLAGALGGYLAGSNTGYSQGPDSLNQPAPEKNTSAPAPGSIESVAQKMSPAVVELEHSSGQGQVSGSGVVFGSDGLILTNNHVIAQGNGASITAIWRDGRRAEVQIVGQDPTSDLAVVKAQHVSNLRTAPFGRSDDLRVGQPVVAFGAPFHLAGTVTSGIVSALHRATRAGGENGDQATVLDAVQTDAAINPGNSGGPLVNAQGQVIGINSAIYSPPSGGASGQGGEASNVGIGFAIPVDQAKRVGEELAKTGKATQPVLGVQVRDDADGSGALVVAVTPGGAAEKAGMKPNQIVVKIDDRNVDSSDALVAAVHAAAPGQRVTLTLKGGQTVQATLGGQTVPPHR